MDNNMLIAPSMRSADWTRLGEEVKDLEAAGADMLHFDVADGHFINDLAIGPNLVAAIREITRLPLDVHLMFENPENIIPKYIRAGADIIIVHIEATSQLNRILEFIKKEGKKAGVALNPGTSIEVIREVLSIVDKVNVMCINLEVPGKLVSSTIDKITQLDKIIKDMKLDVYIQADGAVSMETRADFEKAGAKSLVVGYPIFSRKGEYPKAIEEIKTSCSAREP
jgi:ribulose-phosphate 3-epimerase